MVPTLHIHIYIYIYIYFCHKQCCPFEFPSLAVILKHSRCFINFIPFLMANPSPPFVPALMTWVFKTKSLCNPNTNSFFLPKTLFQFSLSSLLPLPQTPPSIISDQIPTQYCLRKARAPPTVREKRLSSLLLPRMTLARKLCIHPHFLKIAGDYTPPPPGRVWLALCRRNMNISWASLASSIPNLVIRQGTSLPVPIHFKFGSSTALGWRKWVDNELSHTSFIGLLQRVGVLKAIVSSHYLSNF